MEKDIGDIPDVLSMIGPPVAAVAYRDDDEAFPHDDDDGQQDSILASPMSKPDRVFCFWLCLYVCCVCIYVVFVFMLFSWLFLCCI